MKKKLIIVGGLGTVTALGVWFLLLRQAPAPPPRDAPIVTHSTDTPDEQKPSKDSYDWVGRSNDPKYIILPSIATEGFIQNVGVDQNQNIAVPTNVHMAGWFVDSARPGEKGLSIIDGHVSGRQTGGIFENLSKLVIGNMFTVEYGDGSKKEFKVFSTRTVAEADAAEIIFNQDPGVVSQLNLITCAGKYDREARTFRDRLVVAAAPIASSE